MIRIYIKGGKTFRLKILKSKIRTDQLYIFHRYNIQTGKESCWSMQVKKYIYWLNQMNFLFSSSSFLCASFSSFPSSFSLIWLLLAPVTNINTMMSSKFQYKCITPTCTSDLQWHVSLRLNMVIKMFLVTRKTDYSWWKYQSKW